MVMVFLFSLALGCFLAASGGQKRVHYHFGAFEVYDTIAMH